MAAPQSTTMSRVCPACGRHVAPPAVSCRCGKSVDGVRLTAVSVRPRLEPPPDASGDHAIKIGIAIAGVIAAGYMFYRAAAPSPRLRGVAATSTQQPARTAPARPAA
ncbi:MAG: hypothetical protein JWL71_3317, partial [Acidobacteria bacterium]|nr:hypothetical protein [Acidobacteriota bacterium]